LHEAVSESLMPAVATFVPRGKRMEDWELASRNGQAIKKGGD